jgi:hypothetical protein
MAVDNEQILGLYTINHKKKLQELEDCNKQELGEFQADILKLQEELAKLEGGLAQYDQKKEHQEVEKGLWALRLFDFKNSFKIYCLLSNSDPLRLSVETAIQNQSLIDSVIKTL